MIGPKKTTRRSIANTFLAITVIPGQRYVLNEIVALAEFQSMVEFDPVTTTVPDANNPGRPSDEQGRADKAPKRCQRFGLRTRGAAALGRPSLCLLGVGLLAAFGNFRRLCLTSGRPESIPRSVHPPGHRYHSGPPGIQDLPLAAHRLGQTSRRLHHRQQRPCQRPLSARTRLSKGIAGYRHCRAGHRSPGRFRLLAGRLCGERHRIGQPLRLFGHFPIRLSRRVRHLRDLSWRPGLLESWRFRDSR